MREEYFPHEESVVLAAATEKPVEIKAAGLGREGCIGVRYEFISHDEAKAAGGSVQDVQVKIVPRNRSKAMGGGIFHTFYGAPPARGSAARNTLRMDYVAAPDEPIDLTFLSAAGGTIRWRVERYLIFDSGR